MHKSRLYKVLTWIVVCAQILMVAGTTTVGVLQPTPEMAQTAAGWVGLDGWWGTLAGQLTATLQPLWGKPKMAEASAIRDVGPQAYNQWLTTVHPEENMVVNGSFEMGPNGLNITSIPGWNVVSGKVDIWNGYFNPDGSNSELDLDGTPGPGAVEQTITGLAGGQSYFFEFSYTTNGNWAEQGDVKVLDAVGGTILSQTVTSPGDPNHTGWQNFRQTFVAPADGTVTLRFESLNTNGNAYYGLTIDDVRVARRLINYVLNGSFDNGAQRLNQTDIPNWTVESGKVDVWNGYYNADQSLNELDLAGSPGPGVVSQVVSGLTAGQSYVFEFDYSVNTVGGEQAKAQLLDGATPLIDQTVTTNGDPNYKGWKHFRQSFTAPASGAVTLRFQDLSTDVHIFHGIIIDNVRVADVPLNYVVNGDFEASPAALNIANDALSGWTVTSGPVDNFHPGLLYSKAVDLNGSPGNGKIEQMVTGLQSGQIYAFQFNYENHAWWTTYAYARLLDSSNAKLYEKRVSCKGHVVTQGWCTLRYFFTAPADGQVKIVFENDEADGNIFYGTNIDNVMITRDLNYVVNGNYSSGPIGLNQTNVPGWADSGPTDTHDGFGGEYRFTIDLNGSPGDGKLRQVLAGLTPNQPYTLRYNYASTAHNYLVRFDVKVIDASGDNTLVSANQSTDQLPYVGGWKEATHTFIAPADGIVQVIFANNETDNNPYYAALIDNIQVWGQAATDGIEVNVCNNTIVLPRTLTIAPGGVADGLAHWVRADMDVYSDAGATTAVEGDSVQQWNDLSGAGLDLTQTTAGQKPTYRAGTARSNFNPALDFADDFLFNSGRVVETTDDLTMIAVGNTDVVGGVRTLYASGDNYNDPTMDLDGTWISPWFDGGGTVDLFTGETLPTNQSMIWGMRGVNGNTNGMHFSYSGEDVQMNMTVTDQPNYGNKIGVGSDGGGEDWDGLIPEAITYSRNLSTAEMERVYSYLAVKYGITMRLSTVTGSTASGNYVSSDGTLIWNYAGNSNYHNDVAGIGRDDASGLEQKQSVSVNSDNLITMGLGGIAATNAENINSFDADQSFLLWGNNNGATAIATSVGVTLTRMARIWTVQETAPSTAPIGVVTMRVPQSAFGLGAGQAAFLLRSDDPIFTNSDDVIFFTCDGTTCATTIDFTDGDYFTLARASVAPEITVTSTTNSFGNVGTSETSPVKTVTISNSGNAPLNLTSIQMTNDGSGQFANTNSCGATLNPGASCTVGVTFTPNAAGAQSGVLTIASNDSDEASVAVNLSGTGVAQAPDITVLPTSLTFTDTIVNSAAPAQSVTVTNDGTGNLAIQALSLEGTDSDQFVVVDPSSTCSPLTKNLADGESCTVAVLFSPTSAGAKSAALVIASNDTDEITSTVTLSGVGVTCSDALNTVTLAADDIELIGQDNRAAVCVTIAAANAAPVITQPASSPAAISIPENTTAITDVNTTDDSGIEGNGTLTYTLSGLDAALFTIDGNGNLAFLSAPDYESPADNGGDNVYNVTVTVTDSGGLTDSVDMVVAVTDVTEAVAPTITSGGSVSIPENTTVVTTVTASGTAPITYSIVGGADVALFTIDPNTGALSFITAPDFENPANSGGDNVYDVTVRASNSAGTDDQAIAVTVTDVPGDTAVTLPAKAFLQGAYVKAAGLMTDTLRSQNLLPTTSPYAAPATANASVFAVTGNDAIVDWVLVEVRDATTPATVVASQSALLQRDGDVVGTDGVSTLSFTLAAGNYHVAVKHRNHLGAMTISPVAISAATPLVDFTTSVGYGVNGQAVVGSVYALWMGNTSGDNRVIGAGPNNDRNTILSEALAAPGNTNHNANYIVTGYSNGDVNLDGRVIAAGPGNDINFILYNIFVHPGNAGAAANYVVQGQVP
ncbi:MAG: choice-of-anchor D domain-containing protein [Caldilineaceae bacterium]